MRSTPIQALHEPYANLYLGDYFADTLDLSADEHRALRLLLLETWVRGPIGNVRIPPIAGLTKEDWQAIKPSVLPLLRSAQPRIAESLKHIRTFDGRRLPAEAGGPIADGDDEVRPAQRPDVAGARRLSRRARALWRSRATILTASDQDVEHVPAPEVVVCGGGSTRSCAERT